MKLLCISGSLRRDSYNTRLLEAARELLPEGAEAELYGGLKAVPPYDEDDDREPTPEPVQRLRDAIGAADAVLIATPEYNSSIPGVLKNALDWVSRPLARNPIRNKPVAVIGASTGIFGAVWSQAEARKVLGAMGARVLPGELAVGGAPARFDEQGRLTDGDLRARLGELLEALVDETAAAPAEPAVVSGTRAAVPAQAA